jgi:hypothetical protein
MPESPSPDGLNNSNTVGAETTISAPTSNSPNTASWIATPPTANQNGRVYSREILNRAIQTVQTTGTVVSRHEWVQPVQTGSGHIIIHSTINGATPEIRVTNEVGEPVEFDATQIQDETLVSVDMESIDPRQPAAHPEDDYGVVNQNGHMYSREVLQRCIRQFARGGRLLQRAWMTHRELDAGEVNHLNDAIRQPETTRITRLLLSTLTALQWDRPVESAEASDQPRETVGRRVTAWESNMDEDARVGEDEQVDQSPEPEPEAATTPGPWATPTTSNNVTPAQAISNHPVGRILQSIGITEREMERAGREMDREMRGVTNMLRSSEFDLMDRAVDAETAAQSERVDTANSYGLDPNAVGAMVATAEAVIAAPAPAKPQEVLPWEEQ